MAQSDVRDVRLHGSGVQIGFGGGRGVSEVETGDGKREERETAQGLSCPSTNCSHKFPPLFSLAWGDLALMCLQSEWATVKDDHLFVGSVGLEWINLNVRVCVFGSKASFHPHLLTSHWRFSLSLSLE